MSKAQQIRDILETRGLTLYTVSRRSGEIFNRSSRYYVPHKLYYNLANPILTPTIHQIFALSHITDYRLSDWLAVFGFDRDEISQLRLIIPRKVTTLFDSNVYDPYAWIPWFADRHQIEPVAGISPLGRLIAAAPPKRARDLLGLNKRTFLYARIGERDLHALPYFVSGSIVRADARPLKALPPTENTSNGGRFFLVEHEAGWICSRLMLSGNNRVGLLCPQPPCPDPQFHIGRNPTILRAIHPQLHPPPRPSPTH